MWRYVVKRLLYLIPVIIGVSLLIFVLMDLAPGDIVTMKMGEDAQLSDEQIAELYAVYNLDKPLLIRYLDYMKGFIQGNLGTSYTTGEPVLAIYLNRLPATLKLAFAAVLVSIIISIPLGILSAMKRGTLTDNAASFGMLVGLSILNFWLGLVLIIFFSLTLHWLPTGGDKGTLEYLIMPAITHGTILTIIGTQLAAALGGSVVTETVFAWPGTGRLLMDSINGRDIPMVTGILIIKTIAMSLIMLIVDLLYAAVDPRIRAQYIRKGRKKA